MKQSLLFFLALALSSHTFLGQLATQLNQPPIPTAQAASLSNEFGVVGAVPSLGSDSAKQTAVDLIANAGFGWNRHEFAYQNPFEFGPYDSANAKLKSKGIKTLGLLLFIGADKSHDDWKSYVSNVVSHYGSDISAWEIMNEADNYLSPADYTVYLKEAHDIIKGINSNATIVLSGITSRPETPTFWAGVAAAGGWGAFDVAGLHVYHSGNPEKVNFGGGDLLAEYDRAISALSKDGGGKKIWVTETGYKTSEVGNEDQANWLARTLLLTRSVSAVDRIFIYRLADDNRATYGLAGSDLATRVSYDRIKTLIGNLGSSGTGTRLYPGSNQTLDSLDTLTGWKTDATHNGSLALSSVVGHSGQAMQFQYNFTDNSAYAIAQKSLPINGQPQAIGAWINGDGTKNVWKFRFTDAKGEFFQTDLGSIGSGWSYKQFTIGQDEAYVSWGGDSKIDYPISFNSVVVDRQSGDSSGTGIVDEITAVSSGADLYGILFGSQLAYWKVSGSASLNFCGVDLTFQESPAYASGATCDSSAKVKLVVAKATAKPTAKPTTKAAPAKAVSAVPTSVPTPTPSPTPSQSPSPSPSPIAVVVPSGHSRTWWIVLGAGILGGGGATAGGLWYWFMKRRRKVKTRSEPVTAHPSH